MGHAYMIVLVFMCQTLVYREVTALFSLKRKPQDEEEANGRDPWSKTLNWYFFAVVNYYLYGETIIYYFKVCSRNTRTLASSYAITACCVLRCSTHWIRNKPSVH